MTRPASARVVYRRGKDGRKTPESAQGAVLSASQLNVFNRRKLFSVVPTDVKVAQNIWSFDEDTDELTESTISTGSDIGSLPVEVVQVYNPDGTLARFPLQFEVDGQTYDYEVTSITNNSPWGVTIHEVIYPKLKGKYLVHNHPNGASFSFDDFYLSRGARLAGIEALPNRRLFWGQVREINQNQRQVLNALEAIRREEQRAGLQENIPTVERMMMFALQMKPNSREPQVTFQATPRATRGWPSKIEKDEWHQSAYQHLLVKVAMKMPFLSADAQNLLVSHSLNEAFADKMGFLYSLTGTE